MTYPEALQYLETFINYEKKDSYNYNKSFKLEKMTRLCSLLGDPQKSIRAIHVAGSKGKGSTCAFIYSILRSAGFRTGLYTSPHLESFCERIRIDDVLISEDDVARLLGKIKTVVEKMEDDRPTFFEIYTAIAYLYFKEKNTDLAVYEVGLGGRLDATNVLEPLVSAITPISYEHTDKLGATLREIASEKGGIIKDGSICVIAPQEEEALSALKNICTERSAKNIIVGRDVKFKEIEADNSKTIFDVYGVNGNYLKLETSLLGSYQIMNAATAIGAIEVLQSQRIKILPEAIRGGLKAASWPGRLEVALRSPLVVLDGAQNRASAKALAESVRKIFKYDELTLILGVSKDKDVKGIIQELAGLANRIILTKAALVERALDPRKMIEMLNGRDVSLTQNVSEAVSKAIDNAKENELILVTGSLFVVGEARYYLKSERARCEA